MNVQISIVEGGLDSWVYYMVWLCVCADIDHGGWAGLLGVLHGVVVCMCRYRSWRVGWTAGCITWCGCVYVQISITEGGLDCWVYYMVWLCVCVDIDHGGWAGLLGVLHGVVVCLFRYRSRRAGWTAGCTSVGWRCCFTVSTWRTA